MHNVFWSHLPPFLSPPAPPGSIQPPSTLPHWIQFMLSMSTGAVPLQKRDSSFLSNHQPSTAPQLRVETLESLPFHSGMLTCLILCRSCAGKHGCCEFMSAVSNPGDTLSHLSSLPVALRSFLPVFCIGLLALGRGFDIDVLFTAESSTCVYLLHVDQ